MATKRDIPDTATAPSNWAFGPLLLLALLLEVPLGLWGLTTDTHLAGPFAVHAIICLALFLLTVLQHHQTITRIPRGRFDPIGMLVLACLGPAGALGLLMSAGLLWINRGSEEKNREWFEDLSLIGVQHDTNDLYQKIINNRTRPLGNNNLKSFDEILAHGKMDEKQAMLGVIALKYHPSFLPFLQKALKDPEAAIRIQAAAVSTKLHTDIKSRMERLLKSRHNSPSVDQIRTTVDDYSRLIHSGLLEEHQKIQLMQSLKLFLAEHASDPQAAFLKSGIEPASWDNDLLRSQTEARSIGKFDLTDDNASKSDKPLNDVPPNSPSGNNG